MSDTEREYTPTTFQVRSVFALAHPPFEERAEDFDRWLAAHDAQVRAEALRQAAQDSNWDASRGEWEGEDVAAWLHAHAALIEKGEI